MFTGYTWLYTIIKYLSQNKLFSEFCVNFQCTVCCCLKFLKHLSYGLLIIKKKKKPELTSFIVSHN